MGSLVDACVYANLRSFTAQQRRMHTQKRSRVCGRATKRATIATMVSGERSMVSLSLSRSLSPSFSLFFFLGSSIPGCNFTGLGVFQADEKVLMRLDTYFIESVRR